MSHNPHAAQSVSQSEDSFNILIGVGGSATAMTGVDGSVGIAINPGLGSTDADIGVFASTGPSGGVNISKDIFVGYINGSMANVSGQTYNINAVPGPVSISVFFNSSGEWVGGTVGLGPSFPMVGASGGINFTSTITVRDIFP